MTSPFTPGWQGRLAVGLLRRWKPILSIGTRVPGWVILTKFRDVTEMLERDDVFSVRLYGQRMSNTFGPFYLGMDRGPEYDRIRAAAQAAVRPSDRPILRERVRQHVAELVDRARPRGALDVIGDLAEPVHLRFTADYFGVPGPQGEAEDVLRWFRTTTYFIFNFWTGASFDVAAVAAGAAARRYVDDVVAARRAGTALPRDDVMGRMLASETHPLDDTTVAQTIAGIVSGSLDPGIGLFGRVLDRLFDLPLDALAPALRAAHDDDGDLLRRFVVEAARFSPYPPYTWRYCTRDYVIAAGTSRERVIPEGALVVPLLLGAMFDPDVVQNPNAFHPGRPGEEYLNFGHGLHTCLGKMLGEMLMTEMVRAVLALPNVRRAPGPNGHPRSGRKGTIPDGYYTRHFVVHFDA